MTFRSRHSGSKAMLEVLTNNQSEDTIQKNIITWAGWVKYKNRTLKDYLHHSPNGGFRDSREGAKFKAMGTKAGYPDLILDVARNGYHGLRIELKKTKGGRVCPLQKERIAMLNEEGYLAVVCRGYEEARGVLKTYMRIQKNERNQWECG